MKTILIVEDEISIRENIDEILTLKKFNTITAKDGSEGFILALKHTPDLIISDISMPIMDGWELLENVRKHGEIGNIPFLFLSAKADRSDQRKGMDMGADDYLVKPFGMIELVNAINARFARQQQFVNELNERVAQIVKQLNNTVSHEYNTPLNGILGLSSLMLSSFNNFSSAQIKNFLQMINDSGNRLKKTVEKTLQFRYLNTRTNEEIEAMKSRMEFLNVTENEMSSIVHRVAKERQHNEINVSFQPAKLKIDYKHFSAILEELTENAIKFCTKKSSIEVHASIQNDEYVLSVFNQGRGFKEGDIEKIAPFMQFERSKYEQQGSGLGLANVKQICKMFDLGFAVESEPNKYTKVEITVPIANN